MVVFGKTLRLFRRGLQITEVSVNRVLGGWVYPGPGGLTFGTPKRNRPWKSRVSRSTMGSQTVCPCDKLGAVDLKRMTITEA